MYSLTIRREAEADIPAIRELTSRAFVGKPYSKQREAQIVESLRDTDALTLSFIVVKGPEVAGHVAAAPVEISDGTPNWYFVGPISVAPEHQGEGVGSLLMERALAELRELGAGGAVALGDPNYYGRFGLVNVPDLVYPEYDPQYFMAIPLADETIPAGEVSFPLGFRS